VKSSRARWDLRRFILFVPTLLTSCGGYNARSYRGDGTFTDHGRFWGSGRYVIDLGDVDLSARGVRHYQMVGLPPERLAVGLGFRAASASQGANESVPLKAVIRLEVASSAGTVIHEERPLSQWLRSSSGEFPTFVYCKGSGNTWSEEPGTAWGCVFKPKAGERYDVTLEIIEPAARGDGSSTAKLIVEGGPPDGLP
jgi:hypothetical protein